MESELTRRCCVCRTIEIGKNVLIPDGKYQIINPIFSDTILSRECFMKEYENQLSEIQIRKILSENNLYDSCRHHE